MLVLAVVQHFPILPPPHFVTVLYGLGSLESKAWLWLKSDQVFWRIVAKGRVYIEQHNNNSIGQQQTWKTKEQYSPFLKHAVAWN